MTTEINILHQQGMLLFGKQPAIMKIATGFGFAEGPVWSAATGSLLFSDVLLNRIFSLSLNGVVNLLLPQSGGQSIVYTHLSDMIGSNGLAFDSENSLVFCQHGNHAIAKLYTASQPMVLCSSFDGRPFNSPNDIAVRKDGTIFFTDPPYGLKDQVLNPSVFQPHAGVYMFCNNKVTLLSTDLNYPNGICFSESEKYMFVSSNHPDEKMIYQFQLSNYGEIIHKKIFARINADGIKTDRFNNLFAATAEGVAILSPSAEIIAIIRLPEMATNICFGGDNNDLLFITTPKSVYCVQVDYSSFRKNKLKGQQIQTTITN